jgi:hypothetical protein
VTSKHDNHFNGRDPIGVLFHSTRNPMGNANIKRGNVYQPDEPTEVVRSRAIGRWEPFGNHEGWGARDPRACL